MDRDERAETARLQAVAALRLLDTPPEERFDRLVRLASRMFDVPTAMVTLIDEDRQFHKAEVGFGARELPRSQSFCDHAIRTPELMMVPDTHLDDRFRENPLVTGSQGLRFYAGQPITTPSGVAVGALCLLDSRPRELTTDEQDMLRELGAMVEAELARSEDLDRAREVQLRLLPQGAPVVPGYDVAGRCVPVGAIGGDFFDWYWLGDHFQVVVADVMGKGTGAAIIGAGTRAVMRGTSMYNDLESAMSRLATSLENDLSDTGSFVTMFAARLDPASHQVEYVDAGHGLAGVVTADGALRMLRSDGMPLGAPGADTWDARREPLGPGDTLLILSDGLLDLFETLEEATEAARGVVMQSRTADEIVAEVADYGRRHSTTDDVTALVVRRTA